MKKISLLCDYEHTLFRAKLSYRLQGIYDTEKEGIESAKYLFRYVFENLLFWSPKQVRDYLNKDIIHMFKLENCYKKATEYFPTELSAEKDYFYVAHWIYPDVLPYNKEKIVLEVYEQVLSGVRKRTPNSFFKKEDGKKNYLICFGAAISKEFFNKSLEEIYAFFSKDSNLNAFLKKYYLNQAFKTYYDNGLEAIHELFNDEEKNDFFYTYYIFMSLYENKTKTLKKGIIFKYDSTI